MSPIETVTEHYKVIIDKQATAILDKYHPDESTYVILEGPRLTTIGFEKISKGWRDFCESAIMLQSIHWIEGPFENEHATMAWVAGIIELQVAISGKELKNTFRASFVLLKENEEWKIQHEHVSVVHPDPYGIGDWLVNK
jgi:ketosteroid isomerase-like protein